MSAKPKARPQARSQVVPHEVGSIQSADRLAEVMVEAINLNASAPRSRQVVNLVVGVNRVITGLGARAFGVVVTPTVADAAFAWSFRSVDDQVAEITVIGIDQPACPLEFFR